LYLGKKFTWGGGGGGGLKDHLQSGECPVGSVLVAIALQTTKTKVQWQKKMEYFIKQSVGGESGGGPEK